jgi:hypothetical protein
MRIEMWLRMVMMMEVRWVRRRGTRTALAQPMQECPQQARKMTVIHMGEGGWRRRRMGKQVRITWTVWVKEAEGVPARARCLVGARVAEKARRKGERVCA